MVAKSLDLNKPWSRKYGGKKTKRNDTYDCSVHCCTLEQNGNSHFFSIVRQCKWPSLSRKVVEIHKCCYHGNRTSHTPLHWTARQQTIIHLPLNGIQWTCAYCKLFSNGRNQFKFDYHFFTMLLDISSSCSKTAVNKPQLRIILHKF